MKDGLSGRIILTNDKFDFRYYEDRNPTHEIRLRKFVLNGVKYKVYYTKNGNSFAKSYGTKKEIRVIVKGTN